MHLLKLIPKAIAILALASVALASVALAGDLEDGQALKAAGKYDKALTKFEAAVAADAGSVDAALGLSETLLGLGRTEEAAKVLGPAVLANPEHVGLLVARSRAYMLRADQGAADGEDGQLIQSFAADSDLWAGKALTLDPGNADAVYLHAKVLQHQGGAAAGYEALAGNAKSHPDHFDTQFALGQYWVLQARQNQQDKGMWAKAETAYNAAAQADPKSGEAVLQRTYAQAWQQKLPREVLAVNYETAAMMLPGSEGPLKQIYTCLKTTPKDCAAAYERILKERPKDAQVMQWLAFAQADDDRIEDAVKTLSRAEKAAPDNIWVRFNKAKFLQRLAEHDKAVALFEKVAGEWKGQFVKAAWDHIGYIYAVKSPGLSRAQREKLWTAAWSAYPQYAASANNAGLWYRDSAKDFEQSLKWYLRAAEHAQASPAVQNDTGLIYHYHTKDQEKALPFYQRAIDAAEEQGLDWRGKGQEDVGYHDALNNMGLILAKLKKWKQLGAFVDEHLPEDHPGHDGWKKRAEKGK